MKKTKPLSTSSSHPLHQIETALNNVEEFINYKNEEILHLSTQGHASDSPSKKSLREKIKHLVREIVHSALNDQLQITKQLLQSVQVLKKHYQLIEKKLLSGSSEEKEWAAWGLAIIHRYNDFIDSIESKPKSLSQRVTKYMYEKSGVSINENLVKHKICIPRDPSFYFNSSQIDLEERIALSSEKITSFLQASCITEHLSKQETDIFRMKTISLSDHSDLPDSLRNCLRNMAWNTPFHGIITSSSEEADSVISIVQTLIPFPGEVINVRGAFRRDKHSPVSSVPIQESFQLTTAVSQTGFPQPSQHTGFALSHFLIPETLLHPELVPHLLQVLESKQAIALELLPKGNINEMAKQMLKRKKEIFETHLEKHLEGHKNLSLSIVLQAPYELVEKKDSENIIQFFYDQLSTSLLPFRYLSQTNLILNQLFLVKPWLEIHNQCLEHHEGLFHEEPKMRQQSCETLMSEKISQSDSIIQEQKKAATDEIERAILGYLQLMGKIIGTAGKSLMQQILSEKIGFAPPLLRQFELSLHTMVFRQLLSFHRELRNPNEISSDSMLQAMNAEINILNQSKTGDILTNQAKAIVQELEVYFSSN